MSFPNNHHIVLKEFLRDYSSEITKGFESINIEEIEKIAKLINNTIKQGHTIFSCGNGGSSAISEHFVCDFLKGASLDTDIKPIIHSLSSNTPTLTAISNDMDYSNIFSFQLESYGKPGDVLISISSSGNSENIIEAIKLAKKKKLISISFLGFDGGKAKKISDFSIHVESENYGVSEDIHHSLMHILAQYIRLKNFIDLNKLDSKKF